MKKWLKTFKCETSLAVQWLKTELPMQGVQVRSLVGELRSHVLCDTAKKRIQNTKQTVMTMLHTVTGVYRHVCV